MTDSPVAKRAKLDKDLNDLKHVIWEHYRNYLDSIDLDEDGGGSQEGDIDELQELIEVSKDRVTKPSLQSEKISTNDEIEKCSISRPNWQSTEDMIQILLSVAYYHLADGAISKYLMMKQQKFQIPPSPDEESLVQNKDEKGTGISLGVAEALETAQNLLVQSLEWYPYNAATWSMGANFGRMSQSLPTTSARQWYEMAVRASTVLRKHALEALDDESIPNEEKEWIELLVLNQVLGVEYEDGDQEEEEDEEVDEEERSTENQNDRSEISSKVGDKNDEDESEADTGFYSSSAVESTSRFMCAMLLSMANRHDRALDYLKPFRLTHRLHPNVWRIAPSTTPKSLLAPPLKPPLVFKPQGGILPTNLYDSMIKLFAPDAAFWRESDYSTRGYYSFFHEFNASDERQPRNLIEEVILNHLLPRAQQCLDNMIESEDETVESNGSTNICGFEWWAHTRPIQANLGHNLHFDTDESLLDQEGKITHPVLSSVLYLTGGNDQSSSPAGATIILDETPHSTTIGNNCWQGIPEDNTFLIFPGNRLHGVLPCSGIRNQHQEETLDKGKSFQIKELMNNWKNQKTLEKSDAPELCSEGPPHRLTFMVGFWTRNVPASMKHRSLYGPCGPLPPATEEHTWASEIMQGYGDKNVKRPVAKTVVTATSLSHVSPAWEIIENKEEESGVDMSSETEPIPIIPHGIDHRFFVRDAPRCFSQSLFEDRDVDNS